MNEFGDIELCLQSELAMNILSGKVIYQGLLSCTPETVTMILDEMISRVNAEFLMISGDPYCLPMDYANAFGAIDLPKGLIMCDTHHGDRPLTKTIEFCYSAKVQSVLLRFNQRHVGLLEAAGLWCDATVVSPDLVRLFKESMKQESLPNRGVRRVWHKETLNSRGTFVGNMENAHPFRKYQFELLRQAQIEVIATKTNGVVEMINKLKQANWGLNLPLNGDFNRRYVEIMLADNLVFTERIPRSQMMFPFSLFKDHIHTFSYKKGLEEVEIGSQAGMPELWVGNRSPVETLGKIIDAGIDEMILQGFAISLRKKRPLEVEAPKQYINAIRCYEECLMANKNPLVLSRKEAADLIIWNKPCGEEIKLDMREEFHRLYSYAGL